MNRISLQQKKFTINYFKYLLLKQQQKAKDFNFNFHERSQSFNINFKKSKNSIEKKIENFLFLLTIDID